ncbi:HemK family methyltransferase [Xylogone sp. PMI_703]|nr:HemK family methyltransferase [Xylogone sp. PMI_703]
MPRISTSLIRKAYAISPLLPILLPGCRTLSSAINELRWIREYVQETTSGHVNQIHRWNKLLRLCRRRGRGEPLQYILGSQPFGELDIKCRPGVLIPRPETEAYTTHLAHLLHRGEFDWLKSKPDGAELSIVDVCSGSGCISLLLYYLLWKKFPSLQVLGVDISQRAIDLARDNLESLISKGQLPIPGSQNGYPQIRFHRGDIFLPWGYNNLPSSCHVIVSNPPYISQSGLMKETARSVRNWEPKLALVPKGNAKLDSAPEDIFYHRLLDLQKELKAKILLMEVGDAAQARRVVQTILRKTQTEKQSELEIWRDWPSEDDKAEFNTNITVDRQVIPMRGTGNVRAVVFFTRF